MSSRGSQLLHSKFLLISPFSSCNRTFLSAQMFLLSKLLIGSLVFLTQEPLTIKGGGRRRSGGPISSSLPRHDVKDQKDRNKRDKERRKEKPRADCRKI